MALIRGVDDGARGRAGYASASTRCSSWRRQDDTRKLQTGRETYYGGGSRQRDRASRLVVRPRHARRRRNNGIACTGTAAGSSSSSKSSGPGARGGGGMGQIQSPSDQSDTEPFGRGRGRSCPVLNPNRFLPSPSCEALLPFDWSFLSHELQFYLNYFYENITHYHYCMINDSHDFFRSILTSLATRDDALLYAVVGFAAYHYTLTTPNGKIKEFLQYYNQSHSVTTLLTILQLATIEEYLGDWVNLMGHQKAAFEILTHLFTPQSAMQSPVSRMMLTWYARFDVFIGIMGSFQTALPREWFSIQVSYYDSRAAAEPGNVGWKFEACAARLGLISMEMSILFGKGAKQEITEAEYVAEHRRLNRALHDWKDTWDPALQDSSYLVTDFPSDGSPDPKDIVNPFAPGVLYMPPLFASTILTCEWHSIALMHESQAASEPREETRAMLMKHSYTICRIYETVEFWPHSPGGSLIILHPCLAIASLFVPRDARHHMWIRRKFALLEVMGYISPLTMRTHMAELFQDEGCVRWWLPSAKHPHIFRRTQCHHTSA
ncbi:hypothetical protein QBC46DRAFT_432342 [Diplogelasinospora grovesii]|uniref:C6 finger domain protein n=1 Tax=Diplogelasinospora grovesii TaxID=303347 RepID=A0AAN6RY92_9PEZI|nr:hypothetical protein QBC46DRAFT_432342 [Diplogelasinospora grovesii]